MEEQLLTNVLRKLVAPSEVGTERFVERDELGDVIADYDTRGGVFRLTGGKRTTLDSPFGASLGSAAFRLHPVHSRTSSSVNRDSTVKR